MQSVSFLYLITLLFSAIMATVLALAAWTRRDTPGALPFALSMVFVLCAAISRMMFVFGAEETTYFFARMRLVSLSFVPPLATLFVLAYTGHRRWVQPRRAWLLLVVPLILIVLLWTHDHLYWTDWRILIVGGTRSTVFSQGVLWQANLLYGYGCFIAMLGLLLRALLTSIRPTRSPTMLLIIGWCIVVLTNLPFAVAAMDRFIPNLTNIGFSVAGVFFLTALRRGGFLDRVPLALQAVYQSMQDGVIVLDSGSRIAAMNPAAETFIGRPATDMIGKSAREVFTAYPDLIKRFSGTHNMRHAEVESGERVYDLDFSPLVERDEAVGRVVVMRDVTETKLAARRALDLTLEQERIQLLAGVIRDTSDELRLPLSQISAGVFVAQRTTSPQERKDKLTQIEGAAAHMTQIIDSLQLLADLDVRPELRLSEFTLREWLDTLPNTVREVIQRRNHRLVRDIEKMPTLTLYADFYLLRTALQQLLHNAALYTSDGGTITLKAIQDNGSVEVTVSDTGVGILPDALKTIFDRFKKLNRNTTTEGAGAGIGLAIVKKVVELHGGTVKAASEPGKGSTFTMRLPVRTPATAVEKSVAQPGLS